MILKRNLIHLKIYSILINEIYVSDKEVQSINDELKVLDNLLKMFDQQSKENKITKKRKIFKQMFIYSMTWFE
jgi:hypothetical protein